jgi:hypothetical protein
MNGYEVFINGTNFLVEFDDGLKKHGFFTNVYVQSENEEQAEYVAMDLLREHEGLKGHVCNEDSDRPLMHAEEIQEISNYEEIEPKVQGLAWYAESESDNT